ncbi:MAG: site-2 protease family protein [Acidimicrobiia bacterium]
MGREILRVSRNCAVAVATGVALAAAISAGVVGTILVLGGIVASVALHEAAHLGAARALGVKATEYFVGFGPSVWQRRSGELRWGLKLLPLGGYVKLVGMDSGEEVDPVDEPRTFRAQRPGTRAAVSAAGPLANLAVAAVLFLGLGIAGDGGIVDGVRTGTRQTVDVLGVSAEAVVELPAIGVRSVRAVFDGGDIPAEQRVLSPVGATRLADQAVAAGPELAVGLLALVNVFLGVLNLVPLLPLDGGHIAVAAADRVASSLARRPVRVDARRLRPVAIVVVAALLVLGAAAMVLDIAHPVGDPFAA